MSYVCAFCLKTEGEKKTGNVCLCVGVLYAVESGKRVLKMQHEECKDLISRKENHLNSTLHNISFLPFTQNIRVMNTDIESMHTFV